MEKNIIHHFYEKFLLGLIPLILISVIGTIGYWYIGNKSYSFLDCFYMTFSTIATIGFGEIIDMSDKPHGRLFTIFVAFAGIGTMSYLLSNFTAFIIEGDLKEAFWIRKMENKIKKLTDHYIICGSEGNGLYIAGELTETKRPSVLIDIDIKKIEKVLETCPDQLYLQGDATDNNVLLHAGVERARGLFAAAGDDNVDLVICLSARQLNPALRIVARCRQLKNITKMEKAGADVVVSTHHIGGMRMSSEMFRPAVVSFLDEMLRDKSKNLRIEEFTLPENFTPKKLSDINFKNYPNLLLLAVKNKTSWTYNPNKEDFIVNPSDIFIFMTTPQQRIDLRDELKDL
ncbi:potassium channel family protein [Candidatus Magnetomonas plexicatena]|uniref:potassium channel family protein n=1 Tax=Candidatus Magnetomonas plexicatena TaxID=2552947 RepID=UPI001C742776|nr:potassium transporter TrkA [Nitrospirales bacterium LBB_01]